MKKYVVPEESTNPSVTAPQEHNPTGAITLRSPWAEWLAKHRLKATLVIVGVLICVILVAVVPPVCVLRGCGASRGEEKPKDGIPVNRLLVHFDELGKTVKSKVSPLLYDYIEEVVLSFGVNIVTFKTSKVLQEVQRILEAQSDVLILLRDRPQFQAPAVDPYSGFSLRGPLLATASGGGGSGAQRRRHLQQGSGSGRRPSGSSGTSAPEAGDELTPGQWSLEKVAARDAWNVSRGERVVVAVVDTGCDLEHPDLKDNLWINPREIPGNGIDDDRNGFTDDVYGFDFAGPCEDPTRPDCGPRSSPQDARGHGSHCTGIIGAVRNNRVGIVGIAPNVSVMCLKVTPNNGVFYTGQSLRAIDYAINNGAHIISCSFGPVRPLLNATATDSQRAELRNETALYELSMKAIQRKNMLLVAAAGNELTNLDAVEHYNPCTLVRRFPNNVVCVMATDDLDQRLEARVQNPPQGSNYGPNTVSVGAPGLQILSTVPPLFEFNYSRWTNMSGSSMATPLVAGVAALVMSILGSKEGNFYKGDAASSILQDSGVFVPDLEVFRSHRVNASAAAQMALARVVGITQMVPQAAFSEWDQAALMEGFNSTYYASTTLEPDPDSVVDESTQAPRISRFDGYKLRSGTLVVRASMNLSTAGMYLIRVNTTANPSDLRVFVGQAQLRNLSDTYLIQSNGGWYTFELRYINPSAPIDILLAEPLAGGEPALRYPRATFYVSSDTPPRSFNYAPSIALSSTWQVLTRDTAEPLRLSSVRSSVLQFDQSYNNSAVLESLNFTATSTPRLRDALRLPAGASTGRLLGLAHTRLRAPDGTSGALRFLITCELCGLYVNGLRVADVYDPARWPRPAAQLTNCVALGADWSLHDLVIRFAVGSAANGSLTLGWLPCDQDDMGGDGGDVRSLKPYLMNNLFWQPASGVAGYVSGLQCDVWLNPPPQDGSPITWLPTVKFRLPTALTQTSAGAAGSLPGLLTRTDPPVYDLVTSTRCASNETASPANCGAASAFALTHLLNRGEDLTSGSVSVYMRCWTFVNAGFRDGKVQVLKAGEVNVYLGAQTVLQSPSTNSLLFESTAPNSTSLPAGYHQLLVVEFPSLRFSALTGLRNGTAGDLVAIDMTRTLLPIPILGTANSSTAVATASAAPKAGGSGRRRRRLDQGREMSFQNDEECASNKYKNDENNDHDSTDPSKSVVLLSDLDGAELRHPADNPSAQASVEKLRALSGRGLRRELQQQYPQQQPDAASGNVFAPTYLGANPFAAGTDTASSSAWLPRNPGFCGLSFTPGSDFQAQTLKLPTVLFNLSLTASPVRGVPCINASAGLLGPVCPQLPGRGSVPMRYVQARGYLRVPVATTIATNNAATGIGSGTTMRRWVLRLVDDPAQTTSFHIGDVTVRNGVEFPSAALTTATETLVYLPARAPATAGGARGDLFLPAVVTARSRTGGGSLAVLEVALLEPDTRRLVQVNTSLWFCS